MSRACLWLRWGFIVINHQYILIYRASCGVRVEIDHRNNTKSVEYLATAPPPGVVIGVAGAAPL